MAEKKAKILLIYTGGTIGMVLDPVTNALKPFNFKHLTNQVPELNRFDIQLFTHAFAPPIDSSDMKPEIWVKLVKLIEKKYKKMDGFVILHGSDTMAFTASALSFMIQNLTKPIILTGSQLPIGMIRTDGKENLITAIEIASAKKNGKAIVPEVAIYFEYKLYRGNRTHKFNAEHFDAFKSYNYPNLAEAGVHLKYNLSAIHKASKAKLKVNTSISNDIAILKLYPGISIHSVRAVLETKGVRAIILETFGSGNASTEKWFLKELQETIKRNIIILNITQCNGGSVNQGKYETSKDLKNMGVVGGNDMTIEAAICKLMHLLGSENDIKKIKAMLLKSISGELCE